MFSEFKKIVKEFLISALSIHKENDIMHKN